MSRTFEPKIDEKSWDPKMELTILDEWKSLYIFNPRSRKRIFTIDTPPPYPSGRPWHIGAVAQYAQIDMIARFARMSGYEVHFPIGIDRNGIPVERYVERTYNLRISEMDRESFIQLCSKTLDELENEMLGIMRRIGMSCDFDNYYRTDSPEFRALTQSTFIRLYHEGLVYESTRPNNFCWECGTTIADAEVSYQEVVADLVYIRFKIHGADEYVTIATTRPELLCSCKAVIFNPKDPRYSGRLDGKSVVVPIYEEVVPIIPHDYAKIDFGTGLMMVCSYGDHADVQIFRELGLEEKIAIGENGRMTSLAGPLAGLSTLEARKKIIKILDEQGFLEKVEKIQHAVPICERSNTPIEIIPMKEYYLKQIDFKESLRKIAMRLKFFPEHHRQLLLDWIDSLRIDWPISRRRFYATEIPLWYCKGCGHTIVPPPGRYYRPWAERPPVSRCPSCGSTEFEGETRTFDTWMDSSITPLYITRFSKDGRFFRRSYPVTIRPQGKDIVRTWLYYTLLRCYQITKKPAFKYVWIGGLGLDEKGEKMSKSKGNVIDPVPIIEKYGADGFRFWSAQESSLGYDFRISEGRIANAAKFLNKLWNVARYVSQFPMPRRARLLPTDEWIIDVMSQVMREAIEGYKKFDFFVPATKLRDFLWNTFADHYIEMTKSRALLTSGDFGEARAAWYSLHYCLRNTLLLLAPIIPFMTDIIWRRLYGGGSIHLERLPKPRPIKGLVRYTKDIKEFNSEVWRMKKSLNLSLKDPIKVEIPRRLKPFEKDLIAMHNIQLD